MTWPVHPAADLFPLLRDDELHELAEDIRAHGLREPLWLWDDPERGTVLLDGRNRRRACELAGIRPETRWFVGDELEAIEFVISENVRRRHLTAGQKAAVSYEALPLIEAAVAARKARVMAEVAKQRERDEQGRLKAKQEQDTQECADRRTLGKESEAPKKAERATDRAAKKTGASGRSTQRFKRLMEQASDLAQKVKEGTMALDRAERILRDRDAERRRVEQAREDAARLAERPRVDLRHGDFREVLADLRDVDAVITDPPYPREFLPLLADLAAWSDKVLSEDGVLAVLFGQTYLPEVYRLLDGHRPYRWTMAYLTPGAGYASQYAKVQSNWKPVLIYGGGPRFADVLRSEGSDAGAKDLHYWGQDYGAFHTLIGRLTRPGQTVVDPFMGSGTTLLAAHAQGRHVIGADIDMDHVVKARERING